MFKIYAFEITKSARKSKNASAVGSVLERPRSLKRPDRPQQGSPLGSRLLIDPQPEASTWYSSQAWPCVASTWNVAHIHPVRSENRARTGHCLRGSQTTEDRWSDVSPSRDAGP